MCKKNLEALVNQQEHRIHELEEILCPCGQHDLVKVNSTIQVLDGAPIVDTYVKRILQCRRCKKLVTDGHPCQVPYELGSTWKGGKLMSVDICGVNLSETVEGYPCKAGDMLFYIERLADGDGPVWIGNKPIHGFAQNKIYVGWGIPVPLFDLTEYGINCHLDRAYLEKIISGGQNNE